MLGKYLSLGSNEGNRSWFISEAINLLEHQQVEIVQRSPVYETEPWGFASEQQFLNQVIEVECSCNPYQLFDIINMIENQLGRKRESSLAGEGVYASRNIDIDILFYDGLVISTAMLQIPHPRIQDRRFVLEPMACISPQFLHPVMGKSIRVILDECNDKTLVIPWENTADIPNTGKES